MFVLAETKPHGSLDGAAFNYLLIIKFSQWPSSEQLDPLIPADEGTDAVMDDKEKRIENSV